MSHADAAPTRAELTAGLGLTLETAILHAPQHALPALLICAEALWDHVPQRAQDLIQGEADGVFRALRAVIQEPGLDQRRALRWNTNNLRGAWRTSLDPVVRASAGHGTALRTLTETLQIAWLTSLHVIPESHSSVANAATSARSSLAVRISAIGQADPDRFRALCRQVAESPWPLPWPTPEQLTAAPEAVQVAWDALDPDPGETLTLADLPGTLDYTITLAVRHHGPLGLSIAARARAHEEKFGLVQEILIPRSRDRP